MTEQPLLVVWEVVGNLELLLAAGAVAERVGDAGSVFELTADRSRGPTRERAAPAAAPPPVPDCAGHR